MTATAFLRSDQWMQGGSGLLYVKLRKRIEEGIAKGVLTADNPLPPEREIAALTGLSRVTVRKAMQELVDKGAIVQRQGAGSFVVERKPRVEQSLSRLTSFTEDMARRGLTTSAHWLHRGVFMPSPEESGPRCRPISCPTRWRSKRRCMRCWKPMATDRFAPCRKFRRSTCPRGTPICWVSKPALLGCASNAPPMSPVAVPLNSPDPSIVAMPMTSWLNCALPQIRKSHARQNQHARQKQ